MKWTNLNNSSHEFIELSYPQEVVCMGKADDGCGYACGKYQEQADTVAF